MGCYLYYIKRLGSFKTRYRGKAANRLFVARAITPRWRTNTNANAYLYTCEYAHIQYILCVRCSTAQLLEKWKKDCENRAGMRKRGRGEREREKQSGGGGLMRRGMMEFANHPALHFSLPWSRFPRPSSPNPHLPIHALSLLLSSANPMQRTFLAPDLREPRISHSLERSC